MAANNQKLVAIALVGGGVYYLWKTGAFDALFGSNSQLTPQQINDAIYHSLSPAQKAFVDAETQAGISLAETMQKETVNAPLRSGAGAYAYVSAGVGTGLIVAQVTGAAVTGALGSLALTGYGAIAALLIWGITRKGWFRGGEEGVYVNPARDDFTDVWICIFWGDPKQMPRDQIQQIRYESMVKGFVDAGVPNEYISPTIARLYAADTMKEFESAALNYLDVMKTHGSNLNLITSPAGTKIQCISRQGTDFSVATAAA